MSDREPFIELTQGLYRKTADCGCEMGWTTWHPTRMYLCLMHASAEKMFEALLLVEADQIEHHGTRLAETIRYCSRRAVQAAIAAATKKEE